MALFGTYWDDAWHTETGRDSFLIAPHLMLYGGISLTGAALAAWAGLSARAVGLRAALSSPALVIALLGLVLTLVAAPADNAWHVAFGRDAVVWSPPHMLGVAGSLAIAAGLLLGLAQGAERRASALAAFVAAAAVIGVCTIPVLEYETDVPQFDAGFYLPALSTGAAFAFGLIRLALADRYAATKAALAQAIVVITIAAVLLAVGMPTPLIPLLIAPAWAFERFAARAPILGRAVLLTTTIYLVYVPYLDWVTSGLYLTAEEIAWGLPLAFLGATAGFLVTAEDKDRPDIRARAGLLACAVLLALPAAALAHDPGQGAELTSAEVEVRAPGRIAGITVHIEDQLVCQRLEPVATRARRAGQTTTGPLIRTGPCSFSGQVAIPQRGRWFVYAEFADDGRAVETWVPVHSDSAEPVRDAARSVYFPPTVDDPVHKKVAGVGIYAILATTILTIPALYRRQRAA